MLIAVKHCLLQFSVFSPLCDSKMSPVLLVLSTTELVTLNQIVPIAVVSLKDLAQVDLEYVATVSLFCHLSKLHVF